MNNFRILARNHIETASVSASPAVLSTLPETNLLLPTERGQTARSTSLASQKFTFSWASAKTCNGIAVTRHNLTTAGTLCAVGYDTYPVTLFDTTPLAAFSTAGLDTEVDDYTAAYFAGLRNKFMYVTETDDMESLELTAADATNPDGYNEITKVFAGKFFELTYNPGGVEITNADASISARADDGSHIVDTRYRNRIITVSLEAIPNDTDLKTLLAIAGYLGKNGECAIDVYPHNTDAMGINGRGAFRLTDSPTFNYAQYGHHKNTMRFEET